MKVTMEFDLPDESCDLEVAQRGGDAFTALREIGEALRKRIKYGIHADVKTPEEAYEELQAEFFRVLEALEIKLDG